MSNCANVLPFPAAPKSDRMSAGLLASEAMRLAATDNASRDDGQSADDFNRALALVDQARLLILQWHTANIG
ncbi:hypothetical protein GCM10022280_12430 [Sphingomonas swuensis]|uniref:Uncharacterized protein n=1 Tax=Sphingomonas swuensis TaxID=977800 RepID=A0ABP7SRK7_9SPHN